MSSTMLYRRLGKYIREKNLPITPEQFRVLTHLWRNDQCTQQQLAECTNRDRANVTRIIDILEREGIVERRDHEADRRAFRIALTDKGKALEAEAIACGELAIQDALAGVPREEVETCTRVLKQIITNLR